MNIIIANWKMNPLSEKEAVKLAKATDQKGVILCVPFTYLSAVKKSIKKAKLGAQDAYFEQSGAYTGEVSAEMLANIGAKYVILGHSEKRSKNDSNEIVNKKVRASLVAGLAPILCVGEEVRDENHEYLGVVKKQIEECLASVSKNSISKIIIAYEPVWAIGKDAPRAATAEEFREMSIFIRKVLADKFSIKETKEVKVIYGASVDEKNDAGFLAAGADGFLLGRASLDPKKFSKIYDLCAA